MELKDFRNIHKGEKILVLGLGSSLKQYPKEVYNRYITIGVNDIARFGITPTYLVFLNDFAGFCEREKDQLGMDKIADSVIYSGARNIFIYAWNKVAPCFHPSNREHLVNINEAKLHNTKTYNRNMITHCYTSPFVAVTLAVYMGAAKIGIIGVDFCGDHAVGNISDQWKTGKKSLFGYLPEIESGLKDIAKKCPDIEFYNLSECSRIQAYNKTTLDNF